MDSTAVSQTVNPTRPLSGLRQDGMPLYQCEACDRHLARDAFALDENGAPHKLCRACQDKQKAPVKVVAHYASKRDFVTLTEQRCKDCGKLKPASEYWADRALKSGLKARCKPCEAARRTLIRQAKEQMPAHATHNMMTTEEIKAVLDQAVTERDEAVRLLAEARAHPEQDATEKPTKNGWHPVDLERDEEVEDLVRAVEALEERMMAAIKELSLSIDARERLQTGNLTRLAAGALLPTTQVLRKAATTLNKWVADHA